MQVRHAWSHRHLRVVASEDAESDVASSHQGEGEDATDGYGDVWGLPSRSRLAEQTEQVGADAKTWYGAHSKWDDGAHGKNQHRCHRAGEIRVP